MIKNFNFFCKNILNMIRDYDIYHNSDIFLEIILLNLKTSLFKLFTDKVAPDIPSISLL